MARPSKYSNSKIFQQKVDEYFLYCEKEKKPYTVTGLAVCLDICLDTLCEYEKNPKFSETIKKAKLKIQNNQWEGFLSGNYNARGTEFSLRVNFGYREPRDVTEIKVDGTLDHTVTLVKFV